MKRPFTIGLTGSIGMGKSTTAAMFREEDIPVWDADKAVHELYEKGGAAAESLQSLCPECIVEGAVDRGILRKWIATDPTHLSRLEALIHPLVAQARARFLERTDAKIVLLDIPLLFETGSDAECDAVVVVTASADIQRERVLSRPEMTEARLTEVLKRQLPDAEKQARADYVVDTSTLDGARRQVMKILKDIRSKMHA